MTDGHGVPIEGTDAEVLKARAEAIATMTESIANIDAGGDGWGLVINDETIQMMSNEKQVPMMCAALLITVRKLIERVENPMVLLESIMAIDGGFQLLETQINAKKEAVKSSAIDSLGVDGPKIAREVQDFLQKMENQNENSDSDIPDSGSG